MNLQVNRNILAAIGWNSVTTLCLAFIWQYLRREEKSTNLNLRVISENANYIPHKKPLLVHIEQPTVNEWKETGVTKSNFKRDLHKKLLSVYIGKPNVNQWKKIGVTIQMTCNLQR